MRFLKVTTFYPEYLRRFYRRRPWLRFASYARQAHDLFWDSFGWGDAFKGTLAPLGYDADELVINAEPLQRAWVRETGGPFPAGDDWMLEVAFQQVFKFDPEILFLDDTHTFPAAWIGRVRDGCPKLRLVIGWCGAPVYQDEDLPAYDFLLSCVPELVTELRGKGATTHHLHHAFDPRVLARLPATGAPKHDLTFVGQIVPDSAFHQERLRMLLRLAELYDIAIFSPTGYRSPAARAKDAARPILRSIAAQIDRAHLPARVRGAIPLPPADSARYQTQSESALPEPLASRIGPPVVGLDMYQTLRGSRATFNSHIGTSRRSVSNMRMFEATGAGTCLVTDLKDNLAEIFTPDEEVVAYRSLEECVEKVRWLLDNPARASEIARRGQQRTLRDHTFVQRARTLHELIRQALA
jgi:spore maturation protein CgeB